MDPTPATPASEPAPTPPHHDEPDHDEPDRDEPDRDGEERRVTWVELFFDLVFVYAVTRCSELVRDDPTPLGLLGAGAAFVPVYWTWVGTTMHANVHGVDAVRDRLGVLAVALCGLLMAIALPAAYGDSALLLGLSYWAARLLLLGLVSGRSHRGGFVSFTVAALVTGPLVVCGALMHGHARLAVWTLAAVVDLGVPAFARRRLTGLPFHSGHLTERYSTLILIALGESVVSIATGAEHPDARHLLALVAGFVVIGGLWWVYFAFGPSSIERQLRQSSSPIDLVRPVLSYGHLALVAGIIAIASVIGRVVAQPGVRLPAAQARLLFGGAILYLVTFAFTRWRLFHTLAVPRLCAGLLCAALMVVAPGIPAAAGLAVLALLLVLLNVVEHRVLPRTLHPARS